MPPFFIKIDLEALSSLLVNGVFLAVCVSVLAVRVAAILRILAVGTTVLALRVLAVVAAVLALRILAVVAAILRVLAVGTTVLALRVLAVFVAIFVVVL